MAASQPKKLADILRVIRNEVPVNIVNTPITHNETATITQDDRLYTALRFVEETVIDPLGPDVDYKLREKPSANYDFLRRQVENHGVTP